MRYGNSENARSFMECFLEDICRYLFAEKYRPFVEIFDLRDTKMKMNLIDEKSFSYVRKIIQGWKSATNVILL